MSTPKTKIHDPSPFPNDAKCDTESCARDRIFEAARKLFYKFGIRGVSVDAIAAEADTTKVTLYRLFESKDDLVAKVLDAQKQRFWKWWDEIVAQHPGNPRVQLDALFSEIRDCIAYGAERGCPLSNAAVEVVEKDHPARAVMRAHKAELTKRLRGLCRDLGAKQPDLLGDSLSLILIGALSARIGSETKDQVASIYDAAKALIDSPALGVAPAKSKR